MNGMIQLLVESSFRWELLRMVPWDMENTMSPQQRGHHITLAYKPDDEEASRLREKYSQGQLTFNAKELRWSDEICALFGTVSLDGEELLGVRHITLGGSVPPVRSNDLKSGAPGVTSEPVNGHCGLTYKEVSFAASSKPGTFQAGPQCGGTEENELSKPFTPCTKRQEEYHMSMEGIRERIARGGGLYGP